MYVYILRNIAPAILSCIYSLTRDARSVGFHDVVQTQIEGIGVSTKFYGRPGPLPCQLSNLINVHFVAGQRAWHVPVFIKITAALCKCGSIVVRNISLVIYYLSSMLNEQEMSTRRGSATLWRQLAANSNLLQELSSFHCSYKSTFLRIQKATFNLCISFGDYLVNFLSIPYASDSKELDFRMYVEATELKQPVMLLFQRASPFRRTKN